MKPTNLKTKNLILRELKISDAEDMFAYASNPEVSKYTLWSAHTSTDESIGFINSVVKDTHEHECVWAIEYNKKLIGTAGFFDINTYNKSAETNYALSNDFRGKGLMVEALNKLFSFAFINLKLVRITAKCMQDNIASERVMIKLGMKYEGTLRNALYSKGSFHNMKLYSILNNEFDRVMVK